MVGIFEERNKIKKGSKKRIKLAKIGLPGLNNSKIEKGKDSKRNNKQI